MVLYKYKKVLYAFLRVLICKTKHTRPHFSDFTDLIYFIHELCNSDKWNSKIWEILHHLPAQKIKIIIIRGDILLMHLIEDGNTLCRCLKESILCLLFIIVMVHPTLKHICFKTMKVVCSQSAKNSSRDNALFCTDFHICFICFSGREGVGGSIFIMVHLCGTTLALSIMSCLYSVIWQPTAACE